ncbi:MAG: fimbrial biogenesis chaperone [Terriglobales bacterium]
MPVRVLLSPRAPSSLLSVRNHDREPLRLQLSVYAWAQNAKGEMQLTPTQDIVFFPRLLTVAPGEERKVRIGAAAPFAATEKTYRLMVEELPPPAKAGEGGTGVQVGVLLRLSIPIFLQPAQPAAKSQIEAMAVHHRRFSFALKNLGNVHFRPQAVEVKGQGAAGESVFQQKAASWYVLAGGLREYELELPAADCARIKTLTVEVQTKQENFNQRFDPPAGACGE